MDLEPLRRHYAGLDDTTLAADWSHGPGGYATPEIWQVVAAEMERRGLGGSAVEAFETATLPSAPEGDEDSWGVATSRYAVLVHSDGRRVAVKRGFCWPAFFLTWMWALARGLWGLGLGMVVLAAALNGAARSGDPSYSAPLFFLGIGLLVRCLIGSEGNRARERVLVGQGFRVVGTVPAATPDEALARMTAAS